MPRPPHLAEMIRAAEALGRDIDFVRADFYDTGARLFFGELTTTPGGGLEPFCPRSLDLHLGALWHVKESQARRWLPAKQPAAFPALQGQE